MAWGEGAWGESAWGGSRKDKPRYAVVSLDANTIRQVAQLLSAKTDDFNELVRMAGLDPRRDFRHIDLSGLTMTGADLRGFDFSFSDFRNVDVTDARIAGARFNGADIAGTDLSKAKGLEAAALDFATIQDAPYAPELVVIPRGEFMMGSHQGDKLRSGGPRHFVKISYRLAVGRYPVTFDEYDHFAQAAGRERPSDEGWGRGRRPVINVSWGDAKTYVAWLASETGQPYRLLSEAEWEYACRAGTTTPYWWGKEFAPENANYGSIQDKTSEVGTYPANPWGLYDMHGNVWEWVEDRWRDSYDNAPDDGSAWTVGSQRGRVQRGGSWEHDSSVLSSASRASEDSDVRDHVSGFRVARTLGVS